jgi:hypothetical protein
VLQELCVEGHTPLYWAIVNRPSLVEEGEGAYELIQAIIEFSVPLTRSTIKEMRLACLARDDQMIFQFLRQSPAFSPVSGTDAMIFGVGVGVGSVRPSSSTSALGDLAVRDRIVVEQHQGMGSEMMVVSMEFPHFMKRMRISGVVEGEWIAKGM